MFLSDRPDTSLHRKEFLVLIPVFVKMLFFYPFEERLKSMFMSILYLQRQSHPCLRPPRLISPV